MLNVNWIQICVLTYGGKHGPNVMLSTVTYVYIQRMHVIFIISFIYFVIGINAINKWFSIQFFKIKQIKQYTELKYEEDTHFDNAKSLTGFHDLTGIICNCHCNYGEWQQ